MDTIGGILATLTIPTDTGGFRQLLAWAEEFGQILAFGIEGTGSYGATLTWFLRRHDIKVVEAGRPDRRLRRANGKSDTLDAKKRRQERACRIRDRNPEDRRRRRRNDPTAESRA
ncbi:IS110 family transposase [Arthrobacter sp. Hz1]